MKKSNSDIIGSPEFQVDSRDVRKHYDRLSFLYRIFWGEHIHHGYWEDHESIERAQVQLIERLAQRAAIPRGAQVLDIGCGIGGSACWLAEEHDCRVTGFTISPVQVRMATSKAKAKGLSERVRFQVVDANLWEPQPQSVDAIWIIESSEHFRNKRDFFARCATALKPGGTLGVCAWLRGDRPMQGDDDKLVAMIEKAMLTARLNTLGEYESWMHDAGLKVEAAEDITQKIAPTWDHCSRLAERLPLRFLLNFVDAPTRSFVQSFPMMKQAYATGVMAFGLFAAKKR